MKIIEYDAEKHYGKIIEIFNKETEGRILPSTTSFFLKNPLPKNTKILLAVQDNDENEIMGLTGWNIAQNKSVTIVKRNYRNKNIGRELVKHKLDNLQSFTTTIGAINIPSIKMIAKLGGIIINGGYHKHNNNPYLVFLLKK